MTEKTDTTDTTGTAGTEDTTEERKQDGPAGAHPAPEKTNKAETTGGAGAELPPLDFTSFILSLSTSVLMHLGAVENPVTKKTEKELPVARQTIDLIELLKDKTAGNLTEEETQLMENVLRELRMLYVKTAG